MRPICPTHSDVPLLGGSIPRFFPFLGGAFWSKGGYPWLGVINFKGKLSGALLLASVSQDKELPGPVLPS